ncbi:MAG: glycosyltransferase family 2 protein [Anaerolineae bacterium]|nr:MAG: glycosyltransferase family 2 protein [Anaerolineae bacterium]
MTTLSVVIPAYNEEDGIAEIMNRVLAVEKDLADVGVQALELLVVNDGSHDRTREIAQKIAANAPNVRVLSHPVNRGYGAALKTGFAAASGELIGFLDADGTYPPEYFPQLCKAALEGTELVIGSRMAGAESGMPLVRKVGNFIFANMISILGGQRITDSASGMRVFHRNILERIYPLPDGLNLTPIMSTRAIHEKIRMLEIPIPYSERLGRSKLSVVRDGSRYVKTITWTVLSYNPVRILGGLGVIGMGIALLVALGLVIARLSGIAYLGPWGVAALFFGMVSGVTGVSLFALGATFNYLVGLFYQQPIRQGLFGKPVFKKPLERNFGWMGILAAVIGFLGGIASIALGLSGWEITRLWFYQLASAMSFLVGLQLMISWVLMRILEELSQRENLISADMEVHISPETQPAAQSPLPAGAKA